MSSRASGCHSTRNPTAIDWGVPTEQDEPLVLSICGWSGSGKTWLIENLIPILHKKNITVAVMKHDAHRLEFDHPHKDSGRFFSAGASYVMAHDQKHGFIRFHKKDHFILGDWIQSLSRNVDCILIEGHKDSPWPKLWLEHPSKGNPPASTHNIIQRIPWKNDRLSYAAHLIIDCFSKKWAERKLYAGILFGGQSKRMGQPKHRMQWGDSTLMDHLIKQCARENLPTVLLGNHRITNNAITRIPDVPNCQGPLAGMLAAMRWNPHVSWLFLACDMPLFHADAIRWLVSQRKLGRWAIVPEENALSHPLGALYEPQFLSTIESGVRSGNSSVQPLLTHAKVEKIAIPESLKRCWKNCNTFEEWSKLQNDA